MKAMILAAGKGERMLPLTLTTPKPLLRAGGMPLIVHHIHRLARAGVTEIIINTAHLGQRIHAELGDGTALGVRIRYSHEGSTGLETAGGIRRAMPLLGPAPFLLVNADVWTDYAFEQLPTTLDGLAHLVLVPNPPHNPDGDFNLVDGYITNTGNTMLTYAGIAVIHPRLLSGLPSGPMRLTPVLRKAAEAGLVSGEMHTGEWLDIGTPNRLRELDLRLAKAEAACLDSNSKNPQSFDWG
ncbi:MAG: nucleotidyltransferase family protein [Halothiobacillaceae bacterium]